MTEAIVKVSYRDCPLIFDIIRNHLYNATAMFDEKSDEHESIVPDADESLPEELELEEADSQAADTIKLLKKKLKEAEKERMACLEDLQRVKADFLNSKKRLNEQLENDKERIADSFFAELLPLLDSFDLAVADSKAASETDQKWRTGIEAIHSQLISILNRNGISEINCSGEIFDPQRHEAVSNTEVEDKEQLGRVVSVLQKGYQKGDRVIRAAKVTVGIQK